MSDVISAWVDSDEMQRLAATLLASPSGAELKRMEVDYGSQFEGFAPEVALSEVSEVALSKPTEPVREEVVKAEPQRPEPESVAPVVQSQPVEKEPVVERAKIPSLINRFSKASKASSKVEPAKAEVAASLQQSPSPEPARQVARPTQPQYQRVEPRPSLEQPAQPAVQPSPTQATPPPLQPEQRESAPAQTLAPASPFTPVHSEAREAASAKEVKTAAHFLKKAQVEGMAGGVIRSVSPSKVEEKPSTPKVEPPSLHQSKPVSSSPFRRVAVAERLAATPAHQSRKLVRPPVPSGDDPILTRVRHFGRWLKGPVGARSFFISNLEGKILIDEIGNPKLIQVARTLAGASKDGEKDCTNMCGLHVRIGEDSILEVVPTPSQFGVLILGLIVDHSLPEESIREVRAGLEEVADARLIRVQSRQR